MCPGLFDRNIYIVCILKYILLKEEGENMKKKVSAFVICCLMVFSTMLLVNVIRGVDTLGTGFDQGRVPEGEQKLQAPVNRLADFVITALQVASVAGVVFAGVSYMFVSSEQKADIKKKLVPLCIGLILVFAGSTVVKFVIGTFASVTNT